MEPVVKGAGEGGRAGKVVVVSLKNRQAFEVADNSEAVVEDDRVVALKGTVTVRKGYALPKGKDGRMGGSSCAGPGTPEVA